MRVRRTAASRSLDAPTGVGIVRNNPITTASATELLQQRLAYSVDEAASVTGLSRDLLYDQMRVGKLGYLKIGRRRIITREHLALFLALQSA
jgi:excisionase family DNA binding protein